MLCKCLDDEVVEVREMAATTLSGVLRLSPRRAQLTLKDRFLRLLRRSPLPRPPLRDAAALRRRHAAILGICALVESYPYTVERWMPELLTGVLAEHTFDPIPVSTTVRRTAASFKRTHFDVWAECEKRYVYSCIPPSLLDVHGDVIGSRRSNWGSSAHSSQGRATVRDLA